jgi:hypothetical protein
VCRRIVLLVVGAVISDEDARRHNPSSLGDTADEGRTEDFAARSLQAAAQRKSRVQKSECATISSRMSTGSVGSAAAGAPGVHGSSRRCFHVAIVFS